MLNEKFLSRLGDRFPSFYARVDEEARAESSRLLRAVDGDVQKALARARLEGAGRLWWPYVKGSVPLVRRDDEAMEAFSRLVLTVDHVVGYEPGGMEKARAHVIDVLRQSLDVARLRDLVERRDAESKAAAGAGLVASAGAMLAPLSTARSVWSGARRWGRWLPPPAKVAVATVIVAALVSVPIVAGLSAGHKAEQAARSVTTPAQKLPRS